jgi:hypothetical protein
MTVSPSHEPKVEVIDAAPVGVDANHVTLRAQR